MNNRSIPSQIFAKYTDTTITVYQAYSDEIADTAIKANKFITPPFSLTRMTWIKPSFFWMLYRAGWGYKDKNQKRILAIEMTIEGFIEILKNSALANYNQTINLTHDEWKESLKNNPIRIQWDPERDYQLNKRANKRTIQIGLKEPFVSTFINSWIVNITEVTELAHTVKRLSEKNMFKKITPICPEERLFNTPILLRNQIGIHIKQ
jgi:hypothetical protein